MTTLTASGLNAPFTAPGLQTDLNIRAATPALTEKMHLQ